MGRRSWEDTRPAGRRGRAVGGEGRGRVDAKQAARRPSRRAGADDVAPCCPKHTSRKVVGFLTPYRHVSVHQPTAHPEVAVPVAISGLITRGDATSSSKKYGIPLWIPRFGRLTSPRHLQGWFGHVELKSHKSSRATPEGERGVGLGFDNVPLVSQAVPSLRGVRGVSPPRG
ncbi:hypothetical protein BHM03_00022229 [Ensete ventricosum]|nr:hypothetical protein BHM03_00022229 [Ensete ventricosum]